MRSAIDVLSGFGIPFEITVVDDGSTDATAQIVERLRSEDPRVRLVRHERNRGYGAALRTGFGAASREWVFFSDADAQFDIREIARLLPHTAEADAIVGYRVHRRDPIHRRLFGRMWNLLVRALFGVRARDIDCAFKLIRRSLVADLPLRSEGAFVSTELLCRLSHRGARVVEVGVSHYPRRWGRQSGASPKVILRAFIELWRLREEIRPRAL